MTFSFTIKNAGGDTRARLGEIATAHGKITTPVFMPVGTQATVKAMKPDDLKSMGAEIVLGNTYHLYLRPGHELIKKLGGLHKFMNWDGPILTDSGGYQIFSLGRDQESRQVPRDEAGAAKRNTVLAKAGDHGVQFQSHIDGSLHFMTPELSVEIQEALGADIIMVFDECLAYPAALEETRKSMERSIDWEKRSLAAKRRNDRALFAIIQGGMYTELRRECADKLLEVNSRRGQGELNAFSGFAIGGLSVGEPMAQMYELADYSASIIPEEYPRYLMGVGMPEDIIRCIDYGIDMFDCVIPTRNARNGMLFTKTGHIYIKQAQYVEDDGPISEECSCYTCSGYSRAYLRHLHMAGEILSSMLSTIHNLHYYFNLIREAQSSIRNGTFAEFKRRFFSSRNLK